MAFKKGFNNYEIRGNISIIFVENRKGEKFEVIIDSEDLEKLIKLDYRWSLEKAKHGTKEYYIQTNVYFYIDGKKHVKTPALHMIVMNTGNSLPIDHRNHNPLDNRKENLRVTSISENAKNRNSRNSNNKSGYRNVSKQGKWWAVQMQVEGVNTLLKKFPLDKLDEAGLYAEKMRLIHYGEFAGNN